MNEVVLSVAIITYNQEAFIAQTLDSIIGQQHEYAYEIIVGDDCSTDKTTDILREYRDRYPNIITLYLNESNMGIIRNYFNVMRYCRGKYVMQCAGDDFWLPGKVSRQIRFMEDNPDIGACYAKARNINERNEWIKGVWGGTAETFSSFLKENCVPAASLALRSCLLKQYITEIDPENHGWLMEDYPLLLWLSFKSSIRFLDTVMVGYRVLSDSASHILNYEKRVHFQQSLIDSKYFLLKHFGINCKETDYEDDKLRSLANNCVLANRRHDAIVYLERIGHKSRTDAIKLVLLKSSFFFYFFMRRNKKKNGLV